MLTPEQQRQQAEAMQRYRQSSGAAVRANTESTQAALRRYKEGQPGAMQRSREALVTNQRQMPDAVNRFNREMAIGQHNTRRFFGGRQSSADARRRQDLSTEMHRRRVGGTLGGPVGGVTRTGWDGQAISMGGGSRSTIGGKPVRVRGFASTAGRSATLINPNSGRRDRESAVSRVGGGSLVRPNAFRRTKNQQAFTGASMVSRSASLVRPNAGRAGMRSSRLFGRERNAVTGKMESVTAGRFEELNGLRAEARKLMQDGPPDAEGQKRLFEIRKELDGVQRPGGATLIRPNAGREDARSSVAVAGGATLIDPNRFRKDRESRVSRRGGASLIRPNEFRRDVESKVSKRGGASLVDPNADREGLRSAKLFGRDATGRARSKKEFDRRELLKRRMRQLMQAGPPAPESAAEIAAITDELKDDGQSAAEARRELQAAEVATATAANAPKGSDSDAYRSDAGYAIGAAAADARGNFAETASRSGDALSSRLEDGGNTPPDSEEAEVRSRVGTLSQESVNSADLRRQEETARSYEARTVPVGGRSRVAQSRFARPTTRGVEEAVARLDSQPRYAALAA